MGCEDLYVGRGGICGGVGGGDGGNGEKGGETGDSIVGTCLELNFVNTC